MNLVLTADWTYVMNEFFDALIPIGIVVVLPIIIVMMEMRRRKHEVDRKTEIMLKAIEKDVEIDPNLFQMPEQAKPAKTVKDKLMGRLTAACICTLVGLFATTVLLIFSIRDGWDDGWATLLIPACAALAVGIAFFISFFVGKKLWAKELEEMDAAPAQTPDNQ